MKWAFPFIALTFATPALSEVIHVCTFDTAPGIAIHYADEPQAGAQMVVDNRPPAEVASGSGSNRFETAKVDGYTFRFSPANSVLDVEKDGAVILSERGRCVTIGAPVNETEIQLDSAPKVGKKPASPVQSAPSKWTVTQSNSLMDDTQTVVLALDAASSVMGKYGARYTPNMIIRCKENRTAVYFVMGGEFLSDIEAYGQLLYRLGDGPVTKKQASVSTDNKAIGFWSGYDAIAFAKALFDQTRLVVRITPYNESPVDSVFEITGLTESIGPLRAACNW